MNPISNNNVNFTARLNITNVANKERWNKIGKEFEKLTANSPNDTVAISGSFKHGDNIGFNLLDGNFNSEYEASLTSDATKKLSKLPDCEIAQKITKVFNALKAEKTILEMELGISKKLEFSKKLSTETEDKFVEACSEVVEELKNREIKSDSLLKDGMLYI